ncbi:uncharacterized protein LOC143035168 isoform X9 [Oratosquilla oratoria]|uniref:uncharacterized protein LOC143035168 isoform X9 n=1 Tax=Oratosquilla oratoria TaxID=337810 RepID=UPI003F765F26
MMEATRNTDLTLAQPRYNYWFIGTSLLLNERSVYVAGCSCLICRSNAHWYTWFRGQLHDCPASSPVVPPGGVRPRRCLRCGSVFSLFFNKRLSCGSCGLSICRKCAHWSRAEKAHVCHLCAPKPQPPPPPPLPSLPSLPLPQAAAPPFLTPSPSSAPNAAFPTVNAGVDEITNQIRHHLEALVEGRLATSLECHSNSPSNSSNSSSSSASVSIATTASTTTTTTSSSSSSSSSSSNSSTCVTAHSKAVAAQFFSAHHSVLSKALSRFVRALYMSIYNKPLQPHEFPTTRHSELLSAISKVLQEAMILPSRSGTMEGSYYDPSSSPEGNAVEDFNSHTYEDILATAILNKVLKTYGPEEAHEVNLEITHETTTTTTDSTTDTDSGLSGAEKPDLRQSSSRHRVTKARYVPSHKDPISSSTPLLKEEVKEIIEEEVPRSKGLQVRASPSPDQGVIADSHQPESWSEYLQEDAPPLQFKVEEHIEEVTTRHLTEADSDGEDDGEGEPSRGGDLVSAPGCVVSLGAVTRHSVSHETSFPPLSVLPPDPAMVNTRRVSFPELGGDILQADSCSDNDCCEITPGDVIMETDSWEENWLFKKQSVGGRRGSRGSAPPVAMLIPNPTQDVRASVGNRHTSRRKKSKDIDELSELSERHSVASLDPWTTSESEGEEGLDPGSLSPRNSPRASHALTRLTDEIVAEFSQKDQDYTVDYTTVSQLALYRQEPHHSGRSPSPTPTPPPPLRRLEEGDVLPQRPVPKPRKVSLAAKSASRSSPASGQQTATDGGGGGASAEDLSILSPPTEVPLEREMSSSSDTVYIVTPPEGVTVFEGRTLRLSCQARAKGPMGVSWYHNGKIVDGGPMHWVWRRGTERHLQVFSSGPETAGTYAVAAYTASHTVWASCRVSIQGSSRHQKRPSFTKGLSHVTLEDESELTLECQVTGHPEPRVYFSRGSMLLEPSSRLSIDNDQYGTWTLRLSGVSSRDSGEYAATAKNEIGYAAVRCQVNVLPEGASIPLQESSSSASAFVSSTKKNRNTDKCDSRVILNKAKRGDPRSPSKSHSSPSRSQNSPSTYRPVTSQHRSPGCRRWNDEEEKEEEEEEEEDFSEVHMAPPKPGTIAEREYRKWEQAVPFPNNPYAPDKLASRLSSHRTFPVSSSSTSSSVEKNKKNTRTPEDVIEFPESPAKETPPSLRGGVPPRADLTRYSRDYYIPYKDRTTSPKWTPGSACVRKTLQTQAASSLSGSNGALNKVPELKTAITLSSTSLSSASSSSVPLAKNSSAESRNSWLVVDVPLRGQTAFSGGRTSEVESVKPSQPSDWKDELKDIQEAHVVKQVARLQRTINETQEQWEQNFRSKSHRNSQPGFHSSADTLDRGFVSLEGSRDNLWRTVSADTLDTSSNSAVEERYPTQVLRHHSTSDEATTEHLSNTPSCDSENFDIYHKKLNRINNKNMRNSATYRHSRSMERMSGCSDGESLEDSDVSSRTPDVLPALPSVKKLATKFDKRQENYVNNLDKRDRKVPEDFYGNKNIVVTDKSRPPSDKPFNRALSNNLNRSTEKLYSIKEVRTRPLDPVDSHEDLTRTVSPDDEDLSEYDDARSSVSFSLPPTPSTPPRRLSVGSSDSPTEFYDSRDLDSLYADSTSSTRPETRTIFGVRLRKTNVNEYKTRTRIISESSVSLSGFSDYDLPSYSSMLSLTTTPETGQYVPGRTDDDEEEEEEEEEDLDLESFGALRQVTIIKVDGETGGALGRGLRESTASVGSPGLHSSRHGAVPDNQLTPKSLTSYHKPLINGSLGRTNPTVTMTRQASMPNLAFTPSPTKSSSSNASPFGPAFAKFQGKKPSMSDFLKRYKNQKSLTDLRQIPSSSSETTPSRNYSPLSYQRMSSVDNLLSRGPGAYGQRHTASSGSSLRAQPTKVNYGEETPGSDHSIAASRDETTRISLTMKPPGTDHNPGPSVVSLTTKPSIVGITAKSSRNNLSSRPERAEPGVHSSRNYYNYEPSITDSGIASSRDDKSSEASGHKRYQSWSEEEDEADFRQAQQEPQVPLYVTRLSVDSSESHTSESCASESNDTEVSTDSCAEVYWYTIPKKAEIPEGYLMKEGGPDIEAGRSHHTDKNQNLTSERGDQRNQHSKKDNKTQPQRQSITFFPRDKRLNMSSLLSMYSPQQNRSTEDRSELPSKTSSSSGTTDLRRSSELPDFRRPVRDDRAFLLTRRSMPNLLVIGDSKPEETKTPVVQKIDQRLDTDHVNTTTACPVNHVTKMETEEHSGQGQHDHPVTCPMDRTVPQEEHEDNSESTKIPLESEKDYDPAGIGSESADIPDSGENCKTIIEVKDNVQETSEPEIFKASMVYIGESEQTHDSSDDKLTINGVPVSAIPPHRQEDSHDPAEDTETTMTSPPKGHPKLSKTMSDFLRDEVLTEARATHKRFSDRESSIKERQHVTTISLPEYSKRYTESTKTLPVSTRPPLKSTQSLPEYSKRYMEFTKSLPVSSRAPLKSTQSLPEYSKRYIESTKSPPASSRTPLEPTKSLTEYSKRYIVSTKSPPVSSRPPLEITNSPTEYPRSPLESTKSFSEYSGPLESASSLPYSSRPPLESTKSLPGYSRPPLESTTSLPGPSLDSTKYIPLHSPKSQKVEDEDHLDVDNDDEGVISDVALYKITELVKRSTRRSSSMPRNASVSSPNLFEASVPSYSPFAPHLKGKTRSPTVRGRQGGPARGHKTLQAHSSIDEGVDLTLSDPDLGRPSNSSSSSSGDGILEIDPTKVSTKSTRNLDLVSEEKDGSGELLS